MVISGCETPEAQPPTSEMDAIRDLTVSGLRDTSQGLITKEVLMSFRVLSYSIVPGAADELEGVYEMLSQEDVRVQNRGIFSANGLAIGVGSFEKGSRIAQKLTEIGAVRQSSMRLILPPDSPEILSRTFLRTAEKLAYANTASSSLQMLLEPGFLGWVLSAKPDPRFRGMVQINLFPAYWQHGIENIRLLMGEEPVEFQPFDESRVLARIDEGGFILLGPARDIPEQTTLDRLLFYVPDKRPKVQFFVIICDSVGS